MCDLFSLAHLCFKMNIYPHPLTDRLEEEEEEMEKKTLKMMMRLKHT